MGQLLKMSVTYCRSNGYLMIGVCLGLTISLFFTRVEIDDNHQASAVESSWDPLTVAGADRNSIDEYAAKINIEGKPRTPQKSPKSLVRPRYYFTELGIREKLFVGVLTSQEYLHSRGVAFNRTVAHLVEKIRYFISIPEGTKKPNVTLSGIVGFTDTRDLLKPFHVIKYITDNYLEDYDYYYIVKDTSYVNARRLVELVERVSVSRDVYLGIPVEANNNYCSLEAGILISNSLIQQLKTSLDWCVKNTFSSSDDINFGRCLEFATKIPCSQEVDEAEFHAEILPNNFNFHKGLTELIESRKKLDKSISLYPITDHLTIYRMNAYFAALELAKIENLIEEIREEILESSHLGPSATRSKDISWPVGNQAGNKAPGRFDVLRWNYFNETHVFMTTDFENARQLIGSSKLDVDRVLSATVEKIKVDYMGQYDFVRLVNGYQKFDASRGMDYILDLSLMDNKKNKTVFKRIQVCKPLGKVEILPVPYVTENTRINMILIVDLQRINESVEFIEQYSAVCMEKKDKTSLMLVLLYDPESPSKGTDDIFYPIKNRAKNLTDKYKKDQLKITWLSVRLPMSSVYIASEAWLKIAIADLLTKKYSPESLLLFVQTKMQLKAEYLNRIRMNTINQWQIFSPIPFVEFNPDLVFFDESNKNIELDLNHHHGRYDDLNYESISFYVRDYQIVRKLSQKDIPIFRNDKDIFNRVEMIRDFPVNSIFELFIIYGDVHVFRAVEPALKLHYSQLNCSEIMSENVKKICYTRRNFQLGHRGQLAKLIKQYY